MGQIRFCHREDGFSAFKSPKCWRKKFAFYILLKKKTTSGPKLRVLLCWNQSETARSVTLYETLPRLVSTPSVVTGQLFSTGANYLVLDLTTQ